MSSTAPAGFSQPVIDMSKPSIVLRIRSCDSSRLEWRFSIEQKSSDVYAFVNAIDTHIQGRKWKLMTTLASKSWQEVKHLWARSSD
jgi:hypothetical protein